MKSEIKPMTQYALFFQTGCGRLTPNAIALYFALMGANNNALWEEWFPITIDRLKYLTGMKSHNTILSARNLLKETGYIDFIQGGNHVPTKYKIYPLQKNQSFPDVSNNNASGNASGNRSGNVSGNQSNNDNSIREEKSREDISLETERNPETASDGFSRIVQAYMDNIQPDASKMIIDQLGELCDSYRTEWVYQAVMIAARKHAHSVRYIEAVLRNWKSENRGDRPWESRSDKDGYSYDPRHPKGMTDEEYAKWERQYLKNIDKEMERRRKERNDPISVSEEDREKTIASLEKYRAKFAERQKQLAEEKAKREQEEKFDAERRAVYAREGYKEECLFALDEVSADNPYRQEIYKKVREWGYLEAAQ